MINIIRRIFGTKITVTQEHIDRRGQLDSNEDPVSLAIQEKLTKKYGLIAQENSDGIWNMVPKKQIRSRGTLYFFTKINNKHGGYKIGFITSVPNLVYDFLVMWDCYGEGKPFSFYYCI